MLGLGVLVEGDSSLKTPLELLHDFESFSFEKVRGESAEELCAGVEWARGLGLIGVGLHSERLGSQVGTEGPCFSGGFG